MLYVTPSLCSNPTGGGGGGWGGGWRAAVGDYPELVPPGDNPLPPCPQTFTGRRVCVAVAAAVTNGISTGNGRRWALHRRPGCQCSAALQAALRPAVGVPLGPAGSPLWGGLAGQEEAGTGAADMRGQVPWQTRA